MWGFNSCVDFLVSWNKVYLHAAGMSCSNSMCSLLLMFINQKIDSRSTSRSQAAWGNWEGQGSVSQDLHYSWSLGTNYNFVGSDNVLCKKKICFRKFIKWNWSPCAVNHPPWNLSSNYLSYLVYCKLSSNFILALGNIISVQFYVKLHNFLSYIIMSNSPYTLMKCIAFYSCL